MHDDTLLVTEGRDPERNHGVVNPPIYRASTILSPTVEAFEAPRELRGVYYGRGGTPTTFALEDAVAALDGGHGTMVTGSGKTAIAQALLALLQAGDHLLMVDSAYAPTRQLCDRVLARFGVATTYYDPLIGAGIEALVRPETRIIYLESPGSLTFEVQDVPAIVAVARRRGVLTVIDNTWATPLYFKPLQLGVDVCIHAATKYIGGHSDLMMGTVSCAEPLYEPLRKGMYDLGSYVSPDDCYQALRGLRTLSVRLERHQANALKLATLAEGAPGGRAGALSGAPRRSGPCALAARSDRRLRPVRHPPEALPGRRLARSDRRPRAVRSRRLLGWLREPDHAQPPRALPDRDPLGRAPAEHPDPRRARGPGRPDRRPRGRLRAPQPGGGRLIQRSRA